MKNSFLILILLLPLPLLSQMHPEEELLQGLSTPQGQSNSILIYQEGMDNQSSYESNPSNAYNEATIAQEGDNNITYITQQGANNTLDIHQSGTGHEYHGQLSGNGNTIDISQSGTYNSISQDVIGNDKKYTITQEGQNLELIQIEYNSQAPAYQLHQKGQDMKVTIEQGFF